MNGRFSVNLYSQVGIVALSILGLISLGWVYYEPQVLFFTTGLFAAAIALFPPAFQKNYDLFSTWSLAALSIVLGATIRGLYISIGYPDNETLDFLYFLGKPADDFFWPSLIFLAALVCLVLGYLFGPVRKNRPNLKKYFHAVSTGRLYLLVAILSTISLVATITYVSFTDGFDLLNLSKKRTLISTLELADSHRTWQSLRTIASLAMLAHLLVLADALNTRSIDKAWKYALAIVLFLLAAFIPFYASSRGLVFIYAILSLAVTYYVKQRLSGRLLLTIGIGGIVLFQAMSIMRTAESTTVIDAISKSEFNIEILDRLVLNRNDLDLAKTAHIINSVPGQLEFQYGKTIAVWLVAPIPREIWNSKPLISPGPIIGTQIYGNKRSGVPPGFIGEMYWNFQVPGVLIGAVLLGWLMRWAHVRFRPENNRDIHDIVVYVYGPMQLGYLAIGTSVGYGLITTVVNTVLALVVVKFIKVRYSKPVSVSSAATGRS